MALVQFQCVADAPFIMYESVAKNVFRALDLPWASQGGVIPEDIPMILTRMEDFIEKDKARAKALREEMEESLYETHDAGRAQHEVDSVVFLFQRMVPLQKMLERAQAKDAVVTWGPL